CCVWRRINKVSQRFRRPIEKQSHAEASTEHHSDPRETGELRLLVVLSSLILPYLLNATYSITNRPTPIAVLSNQPMFSMDQAKAAPDTAATDSGLRIPHSTKPTMREPVTPKIVLSSVNLRSLSSTPTPERRPGE